MTKNDFKRIGELRREIARALNLWENAIESATHMSAVITGMPRGSNITSRVENAVVKAEVFKEKYDELCDEQKEIYKRLNHELKYVTEDEADVIRKCYQQGMKTEDIATAKNLSERHVYRLKKSALNKLCVKEIYT